MTVLLYMNLIYFALLYYSLQGKTYGLRGPVVYPDGFGVRPPPVRGPPPFTTQPPMHAPTPFPQLRGATPAAGPPPIRVPFPKSGFSTNEPDFMYFIPNPVMRPSYPK
jgi:hypothetical protein